MAISGFHFNNKRIATNLLPSLLAILLRRSPVAGASWLIRTQYFTGVCLLVNDLIVNISKLAQKIP